MLNLNAQELEKMTIQSNENVGRFRARINLAQSEIERFITDRDDAEKSAKHEERKLVAIREATIINKGVPNKISTMRRSLLAKINRLKREDITVAESKKLRTEIESLKADLRKECAHPFIFQKDGYSGSSADDYEDGRPTERYCVICGFEEEAKDFHQNGRVDMIGTVFETLKESDSRVVKREPYRPHPQCLSHFDIWVPLGVALKPFEDAVVKVLSS